MSILHSDSSGDQSSPSKDNMPLQPTTPANKTILLADDNAFVQQAMQALLTRHGWQVTIANNGEEAVAALKHDRFDLVLMDVQMPVVDGLQATKAIRSIKGNASLPIIGLSASATQAERMNCLESGMTDLIAKTAGPTQLIALISAHTAVTHR